MACSVLIVDAAGQAVKLSPMDWVQAQTRKILETGTTEGIEGHCCIDRSAHSISPHLPRQMPCSRAVMPSLSWFSTALWSLLCWFEP